MNLKTAFGVNRESRNTQKKGANAGAPDQKHFPWQVNGGLARVVQDVPPFMLAEGSPAALRTTNRVGCERNGVSAEARAALRSAYKIVFHDGLITSNALRKIEADPPPLPEIQHLAQFIRSSERNISR